MCASPPPTLRAIANDDVVVTGRVADVRPYLHFAGVVIAPLQIARGVQNKVLEAMAMAKPVVATREATRGLGVQSGVHLWIANAPQRFADAILSAIQGSEREVIISAARDYVNKNHNWETVLSKLDADLERVSRDQLLGSNKQKFLCVAEK